MNATHNKTKFERALETAELGDRQGAEIYGEDFEPMIGVFVADDGSVYGYSKVEICTYDEYEDDEEEGEILGCWEYLRPFAASALNAAAVADYLEISVKNILKAPDL